MDILRGGLHGQGQASLRQYGHCRAGVFSQSGVEGGLYALGLGGEEGQAVFGGKRRHEDELLVRGSLAKTDYDRP